MKLKLPSDVYSINLLKCLSSSSGKIWEKSWELIVLAAAQQRTLCYAVTLIVVSEDIHFCTMFGFAPRLWYETYIWIYWKSNHSKNILFFPLWRSAKCSYIMLSPSPLVCIDQHAGSNLTTVADGYQQMAPRHLFMISGAAINKWTRLYVFRYIFTGGHCSFCDCMLSTCFCLLLLVWL